MFTSRVSTILALHITAAYTPPMTTTLALEHLDEMTEEQLPIELLNDPAHPQNDQFYQSLNQIKRAILHQSAILRPIQVNAAKAALSGITHVKIAKKLDVHPQSVGKYLRDPGVKRLQELIRHMQHMLDGPTNEHRKNILYRIAIDNEHQRPSVSVSAIDMINKMSGGYDQQAPNNTVNITINNELLPKGELDILPHGMTVIEGEVLPE